MYLNKVNLCPHRGITYEIFNMCFVCLDYWRHSIMHYMWHGVNSLRTQVGFAFAKFYFECNGTLPAILQLLMSRVYLYFNKITHHKNRKTLYSIKDMQVSKQRMILSPGCCGLFPFKSFRPQEKLQRKQKYIIHAIWLAGFRFLSWDGNKG